MTALRDLKQEIRDGDHDENLDGIITSLVKTIRMRRSRLHDQAVKNLVSGQHVRILPGPYKPKYIARKTGIIEEIQGNVVWVQLDEAIRRPTKTIGKVGVQALYVEPTDGENSLDEWDRIIDKQARQ